MKNSRNSLAAYILIGVGLYFLLKKLNIPLLTNYYSWPSLLIIIGIALVIHSYTSKHDQNLFAGIILIGLGIHFHGIELYSFWPDHWAIYILIIGIALVIRNMKTNKSLLSGLILVGISLLLVVPVGIPIWFDWIYNIPKLFDQFWPVAIIVIGIYLLFKKR